MRVYRVCVDPDCGQIINPDCLANLIEGGVIQTVSRTLPGQVEWDRSKVTGVDWATYPILCFPDAPRVEVDMINIPGVVSMGSPLSPGHARKAGNHRWVIKHCSMRVLPSQWPSPQP